MGKEKFFLVLILVLGLGLRLIKLDQSFWLDEASQATLSSMSVNRIWFDRGVDVHPPLFHLLAHVWLWFGKSEIWLRLLPVSFGVANIYLIYVLAKKLVSEKAGLISAFLLAINTFHIYYSQEFRSYSLLAFLCTLSMYYILQKKYLWTALINALLLYTHYSSIIFILTQFILFPASIGYFFFTLILYLPWIPQFVIQLKSGVNTDQYLPGWRQVMTLSTWKALPLIIFKLVAGRINLTGRFLYPIYIFFVLVTTGIAVLLSNFQRKILYIWLFLPILVSLVISFMIPQTQPNRLIFILPALIILMAQACLKFPKIFLTIFIYIAVFGNVLYFTRPRLQREQWRQAIEFINARPAPAIVAFSDKFPPFYWYPVKFPVIAAVSSFPAQSGQVAQTLSGSLLPTKVYSLEYLSALTDPNGLIGQTLVNLGFRETNVYNFEGVGLIRQYSKL